MTPREAADAWLRRGRGEPPLVVAHRGASARAPENTLAAFRLAIDTGAPAVECDVHLSADGVPVVIHDERVDRTTTGSGRVSSLTAAELRALDAGCWFGRAFAGERLPALDDVLAVCAGRARVFVELKAGGGPALAEAALAALARSPASAAVISFDPVLVRAVAQRRPDLALGWLISHPYLKRRGPAAAVAAARALGAGFVAPQHTAADRRLVDTAHAAGLPVSVWTVDDAETMRRLGSQEHGAGVDAITTNRPDLALEVFGHRDC
jgi:glycerophosphoryl diester phosphodiesterase